MKNTIKLSLAASLLAAINLHAQDNLGSITVTSATKSEQSIKDITSNVELITSVELEEKNIKTVTEALNLVSGVSFTSNGGMGSSTSLNLRGSSNNRVLILIDGVKYKDHSSIAGTDIGHLMAYDIERIEVIKGAQSGIWGADASAGVINIITKEQKEGLSGSFESELGSFSTKRYAFTLGHKDKNYDFKVSAQKIDTDSFTTKAPYGDDIDRYEDDAYENRTLNLKSNIYLNDDTKIKLQYTKTDALKEYDSSDADDENMKNDVESDSYKIAYDRKIDNHHIELKYEQTNIQRDQIGTAWGVKLTDNTNKNSELTDVISYNQKDVLIAGMGSSRDEMNYTKADGTKADAENKAAYLYLTNSNHFDDIVVTESLRYDDHKNFDPKATGKLGVKYDLSKDIELFANYGTSYSVPLLVKNINPWGDTNMDIKPEESSSYDIGFGYKDLKVTYFHQKVTDLIEWGGDAAVYKNLDGESTFKGLEVDYKKNILEDTLFSINYTNLSAKDQDDNELARRAKENLKLSVDYYGIDKTHLGFNSEYVGERKETVWGVGEVQTGKYTVTNVVINYDIDQNVKIYGKIDNVTDKYYQTIYGYATTPRAYYAGVKVSF
ncbi:MAG: TonB-dependent receptor [Campylobacterota bacterium]|nr:TonB-dependent receptor [Campylobacterota bacterium]